MKVGLCCIIKNENLYLREFVEYYLNLGVDIIYLYDNNDIEIPELVIGDYIHQNKVIIVNYRNKKECQLDAYNDFCKNYLSIFDWVCFFDCDEFLTLNNHQNIKDYLSQEKFNIYNYIIIHWINYDDNNLLYYDGRKLVDRFTTHYEPSWEFKSIIKNTNNLIIWEDNGHLPNPNIIHCNNIGEKVIWPIQNQYDITDAYIKHFITKTISEFCLIKCTRGDVSNYEKYKYKYSKEFFFGINKWTEEKEKIFDKLNKISIKKYK